MVAAGWGEKNIRVYDLTVTDVRKGEIPLSYSLTQNYPNPFNPSTTISYQLPASGFVTVKVYNILGKGIATLVNEKQEAGVYQVQWTPNVSSGVYFYQLQAGGFTEVKKMVFTK
jgi:flagellar hook assembly protein FlgD